MEDSQIVQLYWDRDPEAVKETESKYSRYCYTVAHNILHNHEDAEEIVNDAINSVWNSIPPHKPELLSTYIGKIARRLALKKVRAAGARKRGGGEYALVIEELEECLPSGEDITSGLETQELTDIINSFLGAISADDRRIFIKRYWKYDKIESISASLGFSESKIKSSLKRTRDKLKGVLIKEGYGNE